MFTANPFTWPCVRCGASSGKPCTRPDGRHTERIHQARVDKAQNEQNGPGPLDVVYLVLDGQPLQKYRVDRYDVATGEVVLKRGTGKARWTVDRLELTYDPIADMWRRQSTRDAVAALKAGRR